MRPPKTLNPEPSSYLEAAHSAHLARVRPRLLEFGQARELERV